MGSILYRNFLVPDIMVYFFPFSNPSEDLLFIKTGTCKNLDCTTLDCTTMRV
ncbi:hypothetical protein CENDO_00240 [Corynebacterium endometrii]|uniref:Uncharacterized protein n=1 Tax=Corynebacterium endometrii TaxID=2488819 RepID=A0A4V1CE98_9CORY|nr:hypothetical protein CENDO_00240 [Corynebacterium endometrii]